MQRNDQRIALIGAASGWGAQILATEQGPVAMKDYFLEQNLASQGIDTYWRETVHPSKSFREISFNNPGEALSLVNEENEKLAGVVKEALDDGDFPLVIGGDHSIAVGNWGSQIVHGNSVENFGLIWVDAHMDSHTLQTTPSKAYHGMPVAALLGYGESSFINVVQPGPKLRPEHVVLIGIRSYEPEEESLLSKLGVRVIKMGEIHQKGFAPLFQEALEIVQNSTKGFGISVDLDAFDPSLAPGVGSPEPDGLIPLEVLPHLNLLNKSEFFKGMEITELNPARDNENKTKQLVEDIILSIFG